MTEAEQDFFATEKPYGLILFARNVESPDQVCKLVEDFRAAVGRSDAPVLVDQEGGRVQRLRAPHWFEAPAFGKFGKLLAVDRQAAERATRLATRLIARDLNNLGITVDCSPCLDLSLPETSDVIGDRSFHSDPGEVSHLGAIVCEEFQAAGIIPVIKHIPGHGRGEVDSHHSLPVVSISRDTLSSSDFIPFKNLSAAPWGMTAHIVFEDIDPDWPATQSSVVIKDVIRGEIGFDGLLLTDDLNMQALDGDLDDRARRALEAGVDIILHCSGELDEMKQVAAACKYLSADAIRRIDAANSILRDNPSLTADYDAMIAELGDILKKIEDS